MECVKKCEFQEFDGDIFQCKLYESSLSSFIDDEGSIGVSRCPACISEGTIGTNTKGEYVRKFKQHLGWMADHFYAFKDDFEEELTHMYRLIRELEDEKISFSETTGDHKRESDEVSESV